MPSLVLGHWKWKAPYWACMMLEVSLYSILLSTCPSSPLNSMKMSKEDWWVMSSPTIKTKKLMLFPNLAKIGEIVMDTMDWGCCPMLLKLLPVHSSWQFPCSKNYKGVSRAKESFSWIIYSIHFFMNHSFNSTLLLAYRVSILLWVCYQYLHTPMWCLFAVFFRMCFSCKRFFLIMDRALWGFASFWSLRKRNFGL